MKFLFIFLFLFLLVFTQSISAQEDQTFQVNTDFDLKRPCSNKGFFCDSSTICNVTLLYPSGNVLIDNIVMTNKNSYRNVSVEQPLNDEMGFIRGITSCNNGTDAGLETFDVAITANGKKFHIFPTEITIIILSFIFVILGLTLDRLRMFQMIGSMMLIIMGIITLYPGYAFINWTTLIGKGLGFSLLGFGFYFLLEPSFSRDEQQERYEATSQFQEEEIE